MVFVGSQLSAWLCMTWLFFSVRSPPASDIGPGRRTPLAMPPPYPPALLSLIRLRVIVRTAAAVPGGPWALTIPPPEPATPLAAAVFRFTSECFTVIAPWFTIPAPIPLGALFLSTLLKAITASLPLAMPPAAIGGPSPPGPAVAVLPLTWLCRTTRWAVRSGAPALPLAMPPPLSDVLPLTRLWSIVAEPSRFWIPPPPALG